MFFKRLTSVRQIKFTFLLLIYSLPTFCQITDESSRFNFSFEKIEKMHPLYWESFGSLDCNYSLDSVDSMNGKYSAVIQNNGDLQDFKALYYTIPASYEGKSITLSGFIKTENVTDGWAGLWMRIDPQIAFDNMQRRGIKGTNTWQKYEVTLELNPSKTKQIVFGGLLVGKGKMWMDDLHISIDGKEIGKLKPIQQNEYLADKDHEFDQSSKILSMDLTENKIDDLVILGKIWGFLKYYHPNIAKGNYNWDYELFRILPKILETKNQFERDSVLSCWINDLGKIEARHFEKNKKGIIKISPDLVWIDTSVLEKTLVVRLNEIRNCKRTGNNYYVELTEGVGNPKFKNENPYTYLNYPDLGFRILSLYRYWNIIQYYYPYKNLIEEDWNAVLKEFFPKFVYSSNELEYKLVVLSLITRIHDTHANIWGQDEILKRYRGLNYAPVEITFIENKAVVTDYYDKKLGEKSGLKIGDIIETINNRSVDDIIKDKLLLTPASNYPTQLREIAENILSTNDSSLTIGYYDGNSVYTKKIECFNFSKININSEYYKKDTCFKLINSNISYINPGTIKNEDIPKIMPSMLETKGLILDFRCYPSDFIVFSLSKYLLSKKVNFVKFSIGSLTSPGLYTMTDNLQVGEKNKNNYKGKVVIIVNELTQSSAEYHVMAFRTVPNATVIGSTTAGSDGNVSEFMLPGGINTMISGIGVYYPDGSETQRIGIIPNIEVKPTIKGVREGRDELIEMAIKIINEK